MRLGVVVVAQHTTAFADRRAVGDTQTVAATPDAATRCQIVGGLLRVVLNAFQRKTALVKAVTVREEGPSVHSAIDGECALDFTPALVSADSADWESHGRVIGRWPVSRLSRFTFETGSKLVTGFVRFGCLEVPQRDFLLPVVLRSFVLACLSTPHLPW